MRKIKNFNKLNENQKFFVSKFIDFTDEIYKQGESIIDEINKLQDRNNEKILNEIADVMLKYNIDNNVMNLTFRDRSKLIKKLYKLINDSMHGEYKNENEMLTNTLVDIANDQYESNNYLLSLGLDFKLKKITNKKLNRILNRTIKGKNYSDRIWGDRNAVAKKLKVKIKDFLLGNINCNNISKEISTRFEVDKKLSKRLVRNEVVRVQNQVNEQFFEDNEGEYLLYSATLDNKTCSLCASYDGKVFERKDETRPQLPLHTNDRCTYILLPNKDYRPDTRIDNKTKETINYQTYEEWKKCIRN